MGRKKMSKDEKKPMLTLLINENLINKIDNIAKENNINRSQFIEQILIDYIGKQC